MKHLEPNAIIIFYLRGLLASIFTFGFIAFFVVVLLFGLATDGNISYMWSLIAIMVTILLTFIIPLPYAQLAYKNFFYEIHSDKLTIQSGILWKRNATIPFERIQNVDIVQGPFARMLGLVDLQIQTAGYSMRGLVEGRIPAIKPEDANKLKEQILVGVSKAKRQGL